MKHQVTLGKIYRSALRERVEALGHEVEEVGKHGMWEIKGVPEEVRDEYSSRGREIQGAVGAEATLRSRDVAAKDTRRAKVDPSRMRLMERWLGQMKEKGFDLKEYQESVVPREAGVRETATQPERDHQAKPVPAGPEQASLQTSSTAEKSADTPAQPAEREKAITVPVLDKITHTRHEFNKTDAWEAGMVVKRGDRYQDVLAVDRNGSTVTVRDEEGKIGLYSPKELITGDVQLFRRSEREVRAGDLLKFTATDKEQGQMASQRYTVESVSETGNIRLKGENGRITINPQAVRAQQHIDYGWAVTGYGAQGASSDYVIALEGTEGGRKALASRRAFYISASRVKEHVQIYTDGKADWVKAVKTPERDIKTAHDALAPETQRKQAKAIWAMGQPVNKTAIGRAWVRHQGMQDASLTAKIIPATRRFPEPALALPVYDNNGRSAGLALVSLVASPEGRMTQGETRMVMTERARGAVLQRSQSGNTIVASDLTAALDAVRNHPKDGVVWQTSDEPPSAYLLKVSGGSLRREEEGLAQRINAKESDILLSAKAERNETASETVDLKAALAQEEARRQQQEPLISKALLQENATKDVEEKFMYTDPDVIHIRPDMLTDSDGTESIKPDSRVLKQIAASDSNAASEAGRELRHESQPETARSGKEQHAASLIVNQLANSERDIVRQPDAGERGRMPEHDEQTLSRTIQKER